MLPMAGAAAFAEPVAGVLVGVLVVLVEPVVVVVASWVVWLASAVDELLREATVLEGEEELRVIVELSLGASVDPPLMWKGKEYWKTDEFDSSVILRP